MNEYVFNPDGLPVDELPKAYGFSQDPPYSHVAIIIKSKDADSFGFQVLPPTQAKGRYEIAMANMIEFVKESNPEGFQATLYNHDETENRQILIDVLRDTREELALRKPKSRLRRLIERIKRA